MYRRLALSIGAFFAAFLLAAAPALALPGPLDWAEKSMVYLEMEAVGTVTYLDESGVIQLSDVIEAPMGWCSGSFVSSDGHILTAGHCPDQEGSARIALMTEFEMGSKPEGEDDNPFGFLDESKPKVTALEAHGFVPGSDPMVTISVTQMQNVPGAVLTGRAPVKAQVLDYMPLTEGDLGLLKIDVPMPTPALDIALRLPANGTPVTAFGYPGAVSNVMGELGDTPNQRVSMFPGAVSQHQPSDLIGWPVLEISAMTHPGMSGGPVLNSKGEIVGTVSWGLQDSGGFLALPTGINYATDTPSVRSFLQNNGVPIQQPVVTQQWPTVESRPVHAPVVAVQDSDALELPEWVTPTVLLWTAVGAAFAIALAFIGWVIKRERRIRRHQVVPSPVYQPIH